MIRGVRVSRALRGLVAAGLAVVSLVAVTQMTSHVSQAATPAQAQSTTGFVAASGLKPGDQIAVAFTVGINVPATDVAYFLWAPQAFEVSWTELEFFNHHAGHQGPRGAGRRRAGTAGTLAGRTAPGRGPSTGTASPRGAGTAGAGRRWVVLLVAGWLCQAGLRAWFGRMQVMPLANPDETAYLIAARVLAGGPGADLSGSTLYPGGYPLLITPVYWFTSNPATVYHAVLMINAAISAAIMPLGYLACRRLGLDRPVAYGVAAVAALVPAAFFYSQYAMTNAVFPVITLAWLLATHSWLTASSARGRYAAAAGSALLAGFAYMVHSRGLVMLAGYAAVGAFMALAPT